MAIGSSILNVGNPLIDFCVPANLYRDLGSLGMLIKVIDSFPRKLCLWTYAWNFVGLLSPLSLGGSLWTRYHDFLLVKDYCLLG